MNPKIIESPPALQPARIRTMNGLFPLKDIEVYDEKENIWKGTLVRDATQDQNLPDTIYFSRTYDRENNDVDRCLKEYEVKEGILNHAFILIPKDKCLFVYDPPSTIIKPDPNMFQKRKRHPQ